MAETTTDPDPAALTADDVCRVVGERVREFRAGLGMTMERFAEAANLSIGMLSKIEHGQTSPSLATLTNLANAAGVPFTAFFRGLDEEHDAVVVRAGQGLEIAHEGDSSGRRYEDLGALRGPNRTIEPVLVTIAEPDEVFPLFQHSGVEMIHIIGGAVEYGYGAKRYTLNPGDTMQFKGEVAHGPTAVLELPVQFLSLKVR
ncbi:MAG: XRE family transcriptional regulator [Actinomycetia bacterium]|nr:XRE family transcriptional regulator [Actinomycetes bacterium]MCP4957931.1 XRE family transcriptional regulator [Actinomycetes bacterium]